MTDILSTKEIILHATLGIPRGMKNAISTSIYIPFPIIIKDTVRK